ncbi:MAG TPA: hypothetical protein VFC63_15540 [Blastocatellia bacterium]|nr:hypothetical protein [Blastocatellia bacterium]
MLAASITSSLQRARTVSIEKNVGTPKDFTQVWDAISESIVRNLVARFPRKVKRRCHQRGITQMLRVKSIRLYALYYCWIVYSGMFGVQSVPRKMTAGDAGDFLHVIQSSVASVFVTQENKQKNNKLPNILSQISIPELTVMNLSEFLLTI